MTKIAEVVPLYESNYRDPSATLRVIADAIDAGEHGEVLEIAIVMKSDCLELFGMGKNSDEGTLCLLLNAGLFKLSMGILD